MALVSLSYPVRLVAVVKSRVKLEGARSEASEARLDGDDKYLTTSILVPSPLRSPLRADIRRSVSTFLTNLEISPENWLPYREGVSFTTSA
jgi:hypothetical protein